MADDPRVQELLDELLDSGATPEEVCSSCVELLPVVRERWRQMCRARAELDALFPPALDPGASLPAVLPEHAPLPEIPGYEVEAVLGVGGMGVVFRARHLRLNRVVALKMALAGAYAGAHERERFQREAEAVAALRHPNVVQIHDVGDSNGRPYFTMEFVEGGTLAHKLAGTPIPAREAAQLLATLAGAVHAAHAGGIVHRDLKPANVLLTSDGTPKISDFGLARRLSGEAGLTRTGAAVGTPSYMAPEQARGAADAVGPAVDVYALGAILYELLTGRPPFRAETGAETVHQLLTQDPVPPARLNRTVPRDLETVCLKCLRKEPRLRYATAAALADDLGRFLRGETITARPEGLLARLVRRVRRRPLFSAVVVLCALLAIALVGGGLWFLSDREATARKVENDREAAARAAEADLAATERAADADLREMTELLRKSSWPAARAAMERAKGRLGDRGSPELHRRLEQGARELDLATRLDAIRLNGFTPFEDSLDFRPCDAEYAEAFRRAGLGRPGEEDPADVAARVTASPIAPVLVGALDHWASCCFENPSRKAWLLKTIRLADPDSAGWRARAADPAIWKDDAALARLIDTAPTAYPSLPLLALSELRLAAAGKDPVPFLRRVQQAYPSDFWANARLARALHKRDPREAIRFYQAALAVRPDAARIEIDFGMALYAAGRNDEALDLFRRLVKRAPTDPGGQTNLAIILARMERYDEAIEKVEAAFRHGVRTAGLFTAFGHSLEARGRRDEALAALRQAVALDPKSLAAQSALRIILIRQGHLEEARSAWQQALEADPPEHAAWYGYAEFCLFLGQGEEYRRARTALLGKFGATDDPQVAERTGRACLLLPPSEDELCQVVALVDCVMKADQSTYKPILTSFAFVKGLADYRHGRFEQAIAAMRGDAARLPGPTPRLVLAMALFQTGKTAAARQTLAFGILGHDWRPGSLRDQDGCICHVLRREAERMILPNLPAFLEGTYEPRGLEERNALLGVCQFTNRSLTSAQCFADTFAVAPPVEENYSIGFRYFAACAAAQAGCGKGTDAAHLTEPERATWRAQARAWLRADLAAWGKALDANLAATRDSARQRLTQWKGDPDLARLREPLELEKLSADERKDCLALWNEVDGLLKRAAGGQ